MKTVSVIIPAFNEQHRIKRTLELYHAFFRSQTVRSRYRIFWLVVPNGCTDDTVSVVQHLKRKIENLYMYPIKEAGKGLAIKEGFEKALQFNTDYIGFVDADMATKPEGFYALLEKMQAHDGVIASRYMKGSQVHPPRPVIKRWGSRFVFEPLIRVLLGLNYHDFQCGAKIFSYRVIKTVAPLLSVAQWGFDVELLYLCKKAGYTIQEFPTIWHDQAGSKLKIMRSGMRMLGSIFEIRSRHAAVRLPKES